MREEMQARLRRLGVVKGARQLKSVPPDAPFSNRVLILLDKARLKIAATFVTVGKSLFPLAPHSLYAIVAPVRNNNSFLLWVAVVR